MREPIEEFLITVRGCLDHTSSEYKNAPGLWTPLQNAKFIKAEWQALMPPVPLSIANVVPFSPFTPVTIQARYFFGLVQSSLVLWFTTSDHNFTVVVNLVQGKVDDFGTTAGCDDLGWVPIDSNIARAIFDAVFNSTQTYANQSNNLDLEAAFLLGVLGQIDSGAQSSEYVSGVKMFSANSRIAGSIIAEQFKLDVKRFTEGSKVTTSLTTATQFEPTDYEDGLYSGILKKTLTFIESTEGVFQTAYKASEILLANDPALTVVNGKPTPVSVYSKLTSAIPPTLQNKLYLDTKIQLEDLKYLLKFISAPVTKEDIFI